MFAEGGIEPLWFPAGKIRKAGTDGSVYFLSYSHEILV